MPTLFTPAFVRFLNGKAFDESAHPRGQPENAGQFAPSEGAREAVEKAKNRSNGDAESGALKDFFGDWESDPKNASKVIDPKTGKPQVVYHGTTADFEEFDPSMLGSATGNEGYYGAGIYFTPSKMEAMEYAMAGDVENEEDREPANIMSVYLNVRNPFVFPPEVGSDRKKIGNFLREKFGDEADGLVRNGILQSEELTDLLIEKGYDGVHAQKNYGQSEWVVFDPDQIKAVKKR